MSGHAAPIDRVLMRRRERRAADKATFARHFLLDRVAEDMAGRISGVSRHFPVALDLSPRCGVLSPAIDAAGKAGQWIYAPVVPHATNAPVIVADEEWLPFAPGSFDLVVSGLGLHRVNDLPGALVQINRALRPDGLFLGALFGGGTLSELRTVLAEAESEIAGGASPRVMPFGDVSELGQLLGRAGFALPVADVERITVRYGSIFELFSDLRAMSETNVLYARMRTPLRRDIVFRAAELYADRFADTDGRLRATFDIVTLTGWHPDASQPKPLAPGSAATRLADALGTKEQMAGDFAMPGHGPDDED